MHARRGGVRSFLLLFFGAVLAGVVVGYLAGGGSRGRTPAAPEELPGQAVGQAAERAADGASGGAPVAGGSGEESRAEAVAPANPYAGFRVGEFDLVDRHGDPIDETVFEGEVTVLTFFFTSCNGPCPAIARVMRGVQDRTHNSDVGQKLRFASISVDGGRDSPLVIDSFAESHGADADRWAFMTGDPEKVRELVRESIGFELREQEDVQVPDPTGAMMNNILHPTRLLLVGPDRRLIGVYAFNDEDAVSEMVKDALAALGG